MGAIERLFLVCAASLAAFVLISPSTARAEDYARGQAYVHAFSNGITVYSGLFALNKELDLNTSVYFKYNVDMINPDFLGGEDHGGDDDALKKELSGVAAVSGASSALSAGNVSDTRHELTAGVTRNFDNILTVEAYMDYSRESDFSSLTPSITLSKDFFNKNTTVSFGYSKNIDEISGPFMGVASGDRDTDNYYIGLTQVISPVTIAQVGYGRTESSGTMSEGLRLVPLGGVDISTCTAVSATCAAENFPSSRSRRSYMAGISRYFIEGLHGALDSSAIKLFLRYYDDDWDISSYTAEAEWDKYLMSDLILGLSYRYYTQTEAFFVKDSYTSADTLLTVSPQLLAFNSHLTGVKLTYALASGQSASGIWLGSLEGRYQFYTQSIGVNAHVISASLNFSF